MFNIPYYLRQRIVHHIINVIMISFLIISLFPIGWMLFNSFKDNNEILSGRIPLNRAGNDCIKLVAGNESLWACGADGGVTSFRRDGLLSSGYATVRAGAVSYDSDDKFIWISTGEKGLMKLDRGRLKVVGRYAYPLNGVELSKIASTVTHSSNDGIWTALEYKGMEKILEFNKRTGHFSRLLEYSSDLSPFVVRTMRKQGGTLWVGGNKGLLEIDLASGKVKNTFVLRTDGAYAQITCMDSAFGKLFLGTSIGIFEFSLQGKKVDKKIGLESGIISDQIDSILVSEEDLLIGTASGLSILNLKDNKVTSASEIFGSFKNGKINYKDLNAGEVFSVARAGNNIYMGTTLGRVGVYDAAQARVVGGTVLREGYILARWRNYVDMWKNIDFGLYLRNSVIICGISTLIAMILATLAAYSLARFNFPGSKSFSLAILATQMIPAIMYLIPIYVTFVKITELTGIPIKGTFYGMILVYSAFFVPFSIWILRGFFAAIPVELEEAARIDGCNPLQVFWYVVLPLAIPGIIATGVYIFLTAWDELMFAWVLTNADTMTIPVGIRNFVGNYQNRFDLMMAAASVATVPVLILFFMLQKYIVKGLTAGAVKG